MVLLEVKNMRKRYGKTDVLKGVDMQVEKGAIYGLVGRKLLDKPSFCANFRFAHL